MLTICTGAKVRSATRLGEGKLLTTVSPKPLKKAMSSFGKTLAGNRREKISGLSSRRGQHRWVVYLIRVTGAETKAPLGATPRKGRCTMFVTKKLWSRETLLKTFSDQKSQRDLKLEPRGLRILSRTVKKVCIPGHFLHQGIYLEQAGRTRVKKVLRFEFTDDLGQTLSESRGVRTVLYLLGSRRGSASTRTRGRTRSCLKPSYCRKCTSVRVFRVKGSQLNTATLSEAGPIKRSLGPAVQKITRKTLQKGCSRPGSVSAVLEGKRILVTQSFLDFRTGRFWARSEEKQIRRITKQTTTRE